MTITVFARVKPKSPTKTFHRCAIHFTDAWGRYEVDEATKQRLEAEQMLEVTTTEPADFEAPAAAGEADANVSQTETIGQLAVRALNDKVEALEQANQGLTVANTGLTKQVEELEASIVNLESQNTDLAAEKVGFANQIQALTEANADLTKQLETAKASATAKGKTSAKAAE